MGTLIDAAIARGQAVRTDDGLATPITNTPTKSVTRIAA
jgi:hypothetical protein